MPGARLPLLAQAGASKCTAGANTGDGVAGAVPKGKVRPEENSVSLQNDTPSEQQRTKKTATHTPGGVPKLTAAQRLSIAQQALANLHEHGMVVQFVRGLTAHDAVVVIDGAVLCQTCQNLVLQEDQRDGICSACQKAVPNA